MKSPLKAEREKRGWTMQHVASQVGVSKVQILRIENDGVKSAETAMKLVKLFDSTVTLEQVCAPKDHMIDTEAKP